MWSAILVWNHTCDFKSNSRCALVRFWNHAYDFRPNCTPLSSITIIDQFYFKIILETGNDKINDTVSNGSEMTRFLQITINRFLIIWENNFLDWIPAAFKQSTDSYNCFKASSGHSKAASSFYRGHWSVKGRLVAWKITSIQFKGS